jgi:hypothetical protein
MLSSPLRSLVTDIVARDDADAAAALLQTCPEAAGDLRAAAEEENAAAVLHELDLLSRPKGSSLDTPALEVRLQGHSVILGRDHAYLMVIIDDHPAFEDDPRFSQTLPDGRRYATLGAGPRNMMPLFSELVSGVNRHADRSPFLIDTFDVEIQHPLVEEGAATERDIVDALFAADARYDDATAYDIVPFRWSDGYNSNSFIAGLLAFTGWQVEKPGRVPGWDKPLPAAAFSEEEALDPFSGEGQSAADGTVSPSGRVRDA